MDMHTYIHAGITSENPSWHHVCTYACPSKFSLKLPTRLLSIAMKRKDAWKRNATEHAEHSAKTALP